MDDNKKIGRPPQMKNPKPITFKLEAELKAAFTDYAASCGQDVSDILRDFVKDLLAVPMHKEKIENYRRQKNQFVKATFATPSTSETSTPKKTARTPRKKKPAQMDGEQVTNDGLKEGDGNAENS